MNGSCMSRPFAAKGNWKARRQQSAACADMLRGAANIRRRATDRHLCNLEDVQCPSIQIGSVCRVHVSGQRLVTAISVPNKS
jgi:hypothetical protein